MSDALLLLLVAIGGLVAGLAVGWFLGTRAMARLADEQARAIEDLTARLEAAREELVRYREEAAAQKATLEAREAAVEKERSALVALRGELEEKFKSLASETFKASQKSFLALAEEAFKRHSGDARADLEKRQQAIAQLLAPMQESLKRYEENLARIEKARNEAYGSLSAELRNVLEAQAGVQKEAARLVNALRAQPKTRGRWGEHQLQRVMELAGMTEHVDYETQQAFSDDAARRLVPDAIMHLPGGRTIVIDAKTSMSAYFDAVEAVDEETRETYLVKHAREIRAHVKQLGAKSYWQALAETPDFVAMFIPGENFFAAAMERDPELFEDAIANRVLIVTPTTLIALAKAVAFGWRQEAMAENAREVAALGRDLYKRLATMGEHVARTGKGLEGAVRAYNAMIGSLESMVLPQARRFRDLKVEGTSADIESLGPVTLEPRRLAARELTAPADRASDDKAAQ